MTKTEELRKAIVKSLENYHNAIAGGKPYPYPYADVILQACKDAGLAFVVGYRTDEIEL